MTEPRVLAVAVHGDPATHQASRSALRFVRAAIAAGHRIERVFFQLDGVLNGAAPIRPPEGEADPAAAWQALAGEHDLDLVLCVSSALRRGVLDADEARRAGLAATLVRPGFTISGLGQLVDAALTSDRLVTFTC